MLYSDLATNEEFLASHVLRIPGGVAPSGSAKDGSVAFKESRTKAKQFTTLNGRTLIIKDSFVYTNKGEYTASERRTSSYASQVSRHSTRCN